jgi:hypothetical protein
MNPDANAQLKDKQANTVTRKKMYIDDEGSGPAHMFVARIAHMQLESSD